MSKYITQIKGSDNQIYKVKDEEAYHGAVPSSEADKYVYVATSGNLEVSSNPAKPEQPVPIATDAKLNLVSKSDIQIKPGYFEESNKLKLGTIQFDIDSAGVTKDSTELSLKSCNGKYDKANRVVSTKFNTAKWVFDTQKAHVTREEGEATGSEIFDPTDFIMQWRLDKWNDGQPASDKGPISVKMKAKSFDLRCHGDQPGGGVAIQPSGRDTNGKENKIKFESSRQCKLDSPETVTYGAEGGKGLEFGTFNNLHSSLYTQDYRFRANAPLYAVVRETPSMSEGSDKFDYPTQTDDFKDILPTVGEGQQPIPTWADVINVVRYIKTLDAYTTWLAANKLTVAALGVDGFDENNMQHPTSEE